MKTTDGFSIAGITIPSTGKIEGCTTLSSVKLTYDFTCVDCKKPMQTGYTSTANGGLSKLKCFDCFHQRSHPDDKNPGGSSLEAYKKQPSVGVSPRRDSQGGQSSFTYGKEWN